MDAFEHFWITTVQTLNIVLQAKHPVDGHGSSLPVGRSKNVQNCQKKCLPRAAVFLSRRIPWVSLPGIPPGVPGVRVPRGPGVPGFFLGPLRRTPWPGRSRGIHKQGLCIRHHKNIITQTYIYIYISYISYIIYHIYHISYIYIYISHIYILYYIYIIIYILYIIYTHYNLIYYIYIYNYI